MAIVGAIAVGVIIGFILAWMMNEALRGVLWDRATSSRMKEKESEIRRLKRENNRLHRRIESQKKKLHVDDDEDDDEDFDKHF